LSLQDELNEISSKVEESDDLEQLTQYQKRCEAILANVSKTFATEQDADLREHLQEVEEQAKETLRVVKQRLADVKIERMDPAYEQRKAQRKREEELKKQKEMEEAQKFLAQGGLGGLLGGIFGGVPGTGAGPSPTSSTAPTPAAVKCAMRRGTQTQCQVLPRRRHTCPAGETLSELWCEARPRLELLSRVRNQAELGRIRHFLLLPREFGSISVIPGNEGWLHRAIRTQY